MHAQRRHRKSRDQPVRASGAFSNHCIRARSWMTVWPADSHLGTTVSFVAQMYNSAITFGSPESRCAVWASIVALAETYSELYPEH